jgi:fructosamine-3-kinase
MNRHDHPRKHIYYWKCDRPAAFHALDGTQEKRSTLELRNQIDEALAQRFPGEGIQLSDGPGQGNHVTFVGRIGQRAVFVRIEDGPERDDYMEVETHVIKCVGQCGVRVPQVLACDASRKSVPFAWQVMVDNPLRDLNAYKKDGTLDFPGIAREIGVNVARWQSITPEGFGPFDPEVLRNRGCLRGFHPSYDKYFFLNIEKHLSFLMSGGLISASFAEKMRTELELNRPLIASTKGVLVHKDLALWNILGERDRIDSFIDWDDSISGDAMDDISLLGCFYDGAVIANVLEGYSTVRSLPANYGRRFWLHLLRNIVMKAVIRLGAGYFGRNDGFFLIGSGESGTDLREMTLSRMRTALDGLQHNLNPTSL